MEVFSAAPTLSFSLNPTPSNHTNPTPQASTCNFIVAATVCSVAFFILGFLLCAYLRTLLKGQQKKELQLAFVCIAMVHCVCRITYLMAWTVVGPKCYPTFIKGLGSEWLLLLGNVPAALFLSAFSVLVVTFARIYHFALQANKRSTDSYKLLQFVLLLVNLAVYLACMDWINFDTFLSGEDWEIWVFAGSYFFHGILFLLYGFLCYHNIRRVIRTVENTAPENDSWAVDNEEDDRVYNPNGSAVAQNRGNEWPRSAYGSTQNGQAGVREAGESGKSPSRAEPVRMQGNLGGKIADGSPSKYSTGSRASRQSVGASPPNNPMFKIAMIAMICALCMLMKTSLFLIFKYVLKGVQENLVTIVYMIVAEWLPLVALIGVFNSPQINAYGAIRDNDQDTISPLLRTAGESEIESPQSSTFVLSESHHDGAPYQIMQHPTHHNTYERASDGALLNRNSVYDSD